MKLFEMNQKSFELCSVILILIFSPHSLCSSDQKRSTPPLILILIDALPSSLVLQSLSNDNINSGFQNMRSQGSYIKYMEPVFPSECNPNIYSMFTGVNPIQHGVFYNTPTEQIPDSKVETLWDLVSQKNKTIRFHNMPICLKQAGSQCVLDYQRQIDTSVFNQTLLTALNELLTNDDLAMSVVYYGRLDYIGHKYGPLSDEMLKHEWPRLDAVLHSFLTTAEQLMPKLNIIITSDHGMTDYKESEYLDRLLQSYQITKLVNRGSSVWIWPLKVYEDMVLKKLQLQENSTRFQVYNSKNVLQIWDSENGMGLDESPVPVLLVAKPGYMFSSSVWPFDELLQQHNDSINNNGMHGYDPSHPDMLIPLFLKGPLFKSGLEMDYLNNMTVTDLFHLLHFITLDYPRVNIFNLEKFSPVMNLDAFEIPYASLFVGRLFLKTNFFPLLLRNTQLMNWIFILLGLAICLCVLSVFVSFVYFVYRPCLHYWTSSDRHYKKDRPLLL